MSDRYYGDFDRWFAEEHDGSPVEFTVCRVELVLDGQDVGHVSLCNTRGPGSRNDPDHPEHSVVHPGERHTVIHRFEASSTIEAMTRYNELLGTPGYTPHPDWDVERGRWRR